MHNISEKPPAILPSERRSDRALFNVITILTLLLTLTVLAFYGGLRISSGWGQSLDQSVTVQVKSTDKQALNTVLDHLSTLQDIQVEPLSKEVAKDLLRPWLGDATLPDDLPIPQLINVQFDTKNEANITRLRSALETINIAIDIDDHQYWLSDLKRKTRIFKIALFLSTLLLMTAMSSAIIFATRVGLTGWKTLMSVLAHIGAEPNYTARLYAIRFFKLSFKAALLGACAALIFAFFLSLFWTGSSLLPDIRFGKSILIIAVLVPIIVSILSAATAWRTIYRTLMKRLYP